MGIIKGVCISKKRKTSAENVHQAEVTEQGIIGDIHFGTRKSPVSLLPFERTRIYFEENGLEVQHGRFGENLVVEGIDWDGLKVGDRFRTGEVILEITRIDASNPAADSYKGFMVCTPMEPYFVFCKVIQPGELVEGEEIDYEMH